MGYLHRYGPMYSHHPLIYGSPQKRRRITEPDNPFRITPKPLPVQFGPDPRNSMPPPNHPYRPHPLIIQKLLQNLYPVFILPGKKAIFPGESFGFIHGFPSLLAAKIQKGLQVFYPHGPGRGYQSYLATFSQRIRPVHAPKVVWPL